MKVDETDRLPCQILIRKHDTCSAACLFLEKGQRPALRRNADSKRFKTMDFYTPRHASHSNKFLPIKELQN